MCKGLFQPIYGHSADIYINPSCDKQSWTNFLSHKNMDNAIIIILTAE